MATATQRSYYDVLGVSRDASTEAIRKAYLKLAHRYHPDKTGGDKAAEEKLKEINEAYDTLKNPEKRKQYDQAQAFSGFNTSRWSGEDFHGFDFSGNGPEFSGAGIDSFEDIFGSLFSGGIRGTRFAVEPGNDLETSVAISLREAATGAARKIRFARPEVCRDCQGAGKTNQQDCPRCNGSGRIHTQRELSVTIPAGIDTGARLRLAGEGKPGGKGASRGDLYVRVTVAPDEFFTREGDDLICEAPVPFHIAALGGKVRVPTLNGIVELNVPAGTQSGALLRMRGLGMPRLHGRGRGDEIVRVRIEVPSNLTKEQRNLLHKTFGGDSCEAYPSYRQFAERIDRKRST